MEQGTVSLGGILIPADGRPVAFMKEFKITNFAEWLRRHGYAWIAHEVTNSFIGTWEAVAAANMTRLIHFLEYREVQRTPEDYYIVSCDNVGSAFSLIKGASDDRFVNAIVSTTKRTWAERSIAHFITYIFSERNIGDAFTRGEQAKQALRIVLELYDPEMINIDTIDLLGDLQALEAEYKAPFEKELQDIHTQKAQKRRKKNTK